MADEKVRLFVALALPEEARSKLVSWRTTVMEGVDGLRPVGVDSLHVTLCFLGGQPSSEVAEIAGSCALVAGMTSPRLAILRARWLPPRRPGVLAVELDDQSGALGAIQTKLSTSLQQGGWYEPEARPFLPHVTVARVRGGGRGASAIRRGELRGVSEAAASRSERRGESAAVTGRGELPPTPECVFDGERVVLYRSRLQRGGAQYEPIETVVLGG